MLPQLRSPDAPADAILGCMNFGKRTDHATSLRILGAALDQGVTHLDTANVYNDGESERIVGRAIRGRADQVFVATKVGFGRVNGRPEGLSQAAIAAACEGSLARLGLEAIDLYYLHLPDPLTPIDATMDGISGLLAAGKIKAWGVSNFASWQILELNVLADKRGMPRPVASQQLYNAVVRQLDVEYFAFSRRYPISTNIYNPLGAGILSGAHRLESAPAAGTRFDKNALYRRRYWQPALFAAVEQLRGVAAKYDVSLLDLAYAFVFRHPDIHGVIVGPATEAHLAAALAARAVEISPDVRADLDAVAVSLAGTDVKYAR